MKIFKEALVRIFENAMTLNKKNILAFLNRDPNALLLDLGCNDGVWTIGLANQIGTKHVFGIDIVEERLLSAKHKGIEVLLGDLNNKFPYTDNKFDVVHANQVIEHIGNLDLFISEIQRILKPGGYALISTENASSWHNIFASVMGWQIFSLTNISSKKPGIGNPWAPT